MSSEVSFNRSHTLIDESSCVCVCVCVCVSLSGMSVSALCPSAQTDSSSVRPATQRQYTSLNWSSWGQGTHTHTVTHTNRHTHTHIDTQTHTHTFTHIYIYTHIQTDTHTHRHTDTHTHIYIHTHTDTHIHTYIYIHTHTYIYTHLHTHTVACNRCGLPVPGRLLHLRRLRCVPTCLCGPVRPTVLTTGALCAAGGTRPPAGRPTWGRCCWRPAATCPPRCPA